MSSVWGGSTEPRCYRFFQTEIRNLQTILIFQIGERNNVVFCLLLSEAAILDPFLSHFSILFLFRKFPPVFEQKIDSRLRKVKFIYAIGFLLGGVR